MKSKGEIFYNGIVLGYVLLGILFAFVGLAFVIQPNDLVGHSILKLTEDVAGVSIFFTEPTPSDSNTQAEPYVEINVTIESDDLQSVNWNWNGTNYTFFNSSLVLLMSFDNRSNLGENSTHVFDTGFGESNGSVVGAVWNSSGKYDGAFNFNGSSFINFSASNYDEPVTFAAWFKLNDNTTGQTIVSLSDGGDGGAADNWRLDIDSSAQVRAVSQRGSSASGPATSTTTIPRGTWYHAVAVITNASYREIYVNGVLEGTGTGTEDVAGAENLGRIGSVNRAGEEEYFNGTIDNVMIWNRSLAPEEVHHLYISNLNKFNQTHWYLFVNQTKNATDVLTNGTYTYQTFASNSSAINATEQRTIIINTALDQAPNSTCSSPADNAEFDLGVVNFTCTASDDYYLQNVTLFIWNSTGTEIYTNLTNISGTSNSSNSSYNFTIYDNYTWNCLVYDNSTSKFSTWGQNRTLRIMQDTTNPKITILSPLQNYSTSAITFNISSNEALDYCLYSVDDWVTNNTITKFNSTNFFNDTTILDGSYTFRCWCNDTAGNVNDTESFDFIVDSTIPVFSDFWDNSGIESEKTALFNATVENTNGTVLLEINGVNYSATNLTSNWYNSSVFNLSVGGHTYYWHAYGNNTLNNLNSTAARTFTVNATCGDRIISTGEQCDDNNTVPGDGCDASCEIESGWWCMLEPSNCSELTWVAPIGIPYPDFGIGENHTMYENELYDYDGDGVAEGAYKDAGNGPYTYYVNNSDGSCDDNNDGGYGNHTAPRCTYPSSTWLKPGSVVEIHGEGHTAGWIAMLGNGTRAKPAFVRGINPIEPIFDDTQLRLGGYFLIVENLKLNKTGAGFHSNYDTSHHNSVRNTEIYNITSHTGSSLTIRGNDTVIYNNHIHNNGELPGDTQQDHHGTLASNAQRAWLVDNNIHHNRGDSFQVNADPASNANFIYIGRNTMHHDGENAVDIKGSQNVIISQNTMYGYRNYCGSDGTAIVAGHEGSTDTWIIFNKIYDSDLGIRANEAETSGKKTYIIGNILFDIKNQAITTFRSDIVYVINNIIYEFKDGFRDANWADQGANFHLYNNLFQNLKEPTGYHLYVSDLGNIPANSNSDYNGFYEETGNVRIYWDGSTYLNVSSFNSSTPNANNSIEADPLLQNVPSFCIRLEHFYFNTTNATLNITGALSTLTVSGMNFSNMSIRYKDRIEVSYLENQTDCTPGGSDTTPHCGWQRVENVSGDTITLISNITENVTTVNMTLHYYPFSSNTSEVYIDNASVFKTGDNIEINHDDIIRTIDTIDTNFTQDENGDQKDRINFTSDFIGEIVPILSICNWSGSDSAENFSLQNSSPAIDNGTFSGNVSSVYQLFFDTYGINISVDHDNVSRPQDGDNTGAREWDLGAYEFIFTAEDETDNSASENSNSGGSGGGGGGGGGGTASGKTYHPSNSQIASGYTTELGSKDKIKMNIANELHYLRIVEIFANSVRINVTSDPQEATLLVGEEKNFELNGDEYYDILVRLEAIRNNKANLTIKSIYKKISEKNDEEIIDIDNSFNENEANSDAELNEESLIGDMKKNSKDSGRKMVITIILVVAILIIVASLIFYQKKKREFTDVSI